MVGVLKVCRLGEDWVVKDSTGAFHCRTPKLDDAKAYAEKMAKRAGEKVVIKNENGIGR